jgi:hypothetical protein
VIGPWVVHFQGDEAGPCAARMLTELTALLLCGGGVNCSAAHKRTALGQRVGRVDHVS